MHHFSYFFIPALDFFLEWHDWMDLEKYNCFFFSPLIVFLFCFHLDIIRSISSGDHQTMSKKVFSSFHLYSTINLFAVQIYDLHFYIQAVAKKNTDQKGDFSEILFFKQKLAFYWWLILVYYPIKVQSTIPLLPNHQLYIWHLLLNSVIYAQCTKP